MMLKIATQEDYEVVSRLAHKEYDKPKYAHLKIDIDKLIPLYLDPKNSSECIALLWEDKGLIAFEYIKLLNAARVVLVYIEPEARGQGIMNKFLEAFEYWGKEIGAKWYRLDVSTGNDLTKRGYSQGEVMFMKEIT